MKISLKSVFINLILFVFGLGMIWLAFRGQNFKEILIGLKKVNYSLVLFSLVFVSISHFVRGLRWIQLIEPMGYYVSPINAFQAVMIGYLANLALPRVGEITRCGILSKATKAPLEILIGTVITERLWDLISLIFIMLFTLIFQYHLLIRFFNETILKGFSNHVPSIAFILIFTVSLIFLSFLLRSLWVKNESKIRSSPFFKKFYTLGQGLLNGIKSFTEIKKKGLFILYTLIIWLGYALASWILFYSISLTMNLGFRASLLVLSVGALGMVAPVQGGIGAYHWMVSHGLLLYNIPLSSGLIYATINHSSGILLIIFLGSLSLLGFFWNKPKDPIKL
jgi:uncharacterized protein (TIRG00374 family)